MTTDTAVSPSAPTRDLARTKEDILAVATQHFTRAGFYGARVDEIASETSTTKRMIYYCFSSKDGLFQACLSRAYADIRAFESGLNLDALPPAEAIATFVEQTIRYQDEHPELAQLIRTENLMDGVHMEAVAQEASGSTILELLEGVLARGAAAGDFRSDVTGLDLHLAVSALANFRITNQATIAALFGRDMRDHERLQHDIDQYIDIALRWLSAWHDTAEVSRA